MSEHLKNLPISGEIKPFDGSAKTLVFDLPNKGVVLKMDTGVARKHPEPSLTLADKFIHKHRVSEALAMAAVPGGTTAPQEHHFIAEGENGMPTAFRVQRRIVGRKLAETPLSELSLDQKWALSRLLWNGLKFNLFKGIDLDLVGTTQDTGESEREVIVRDLSPLANSVNILVPDIGEVSWIDVKGKVIPNKRWAQIRRVTKSIGYLKDLARLQWSISTTRGTLAKPRYSMPVSTNL